MDRALAPLYQGTELQRTNLRAPLDAPRAGIDVLAIVPAVVTGCCVWRRDGSFQPVILDDQRSANFTTMEDVIAAEVRRLKFKGTVVLESPLPIQTLEWREYAQTASDAAEKVAKAHRLPILRLSRKTVAEQFGYRDAGLKLLVGAMRVAGLGTKGGGVQDRAALAAAFGLVGGIEKGWRR